MTTPSLPEAAKLARYRIDIERAREGELWKLEPDPKGPWCLFADVATLAASAEPMAPVATGRVHELKTDPEVFEAVWTGAKTFEIRRNDRGFEVGDALDLRETKFTGDQMHIGRPLEYTGRRITKVVSHVLSGYGLSDHWVCLSFATPPAQAEPSAQEPADTVPTRGGLSVKEFSRSIEAMIATPTPQTSAQEPVPPLTLERALFGSDFERARAIATPTPQTSASVAGSAPAWVLATDVIRLRGVAETLQRAGEVVLSITTQAAPVAAAVQAPAEGDLSDESTMVDLWAEIHRLRAAVKGPNGYASWQDAAVDERIRRVRAEKAIATPQPQPPSPEQAQAKQDVQAVPEGFVLVPMHMTDEMEAVTRDDSWQWEDILAAAGAITLEQYDDIAAGRGAPTSPAPGAAPPVQGEPLTLALKLAADRTREDLGSDTQETNYPHVRELLRFVEAAISNEGVDK